MRCSVPVNADFQDAGYKTFGGARRMSCLVDVRCSLRYNLDFTAFWNALLALCYTLPTLRALTLLSGVLGLLSLGLGLLSLRLGLLSPALVWLSGALGCLSPALSWLSEALGWLSGALV